MAFKSIEKKRAYDRAYNATHKEKLKKQSHEYYLANKEKIIQKSKKHAQENSERIKQYHKGYHGKHRLEVLAKIDPAMKCANCGCDDTRLLEINHIKGGGKKEQKKAGVTRNLVLLIQTSKRGTEDLNLLCRACNALDHLERVFGKTPFRVVWEKNGIQK